MTTYTDDQLRSAVDAVFDRYDSDKSGSLDVKEVAKLINDALAHMKTGRTTTEAEVQQVMKSIDANNDGQVSKVELFQIFKKITAK